MASLKYCFVCGLGSTREVWSKTFETSIGPLVCCDSHTDAEIQQHKNRLKALELVKEEETKDVPETPEAPASAPTPAPDSADSKSTDAT